MEQMKIGDAVLFDNRKTLFGKMIGIFTKAKFTHVGAFYEANGNSYVIAEAVGNGFVLSSYNAKKVDKRRRKGTISVKRPLVELHEPKKALMALLSTPYSWKSILAIAIDKATGITLTFAVDGKHSGICSEMYSIFARIASQGMLNISKEFNKDEDYVTPANIASSKQFVTID